jgi:hypothetical protein
MTHWTSVNFLFQRKLTIAFTFTQHYKPKSCTHKGKDNTKAFEFPIHSNSKFRVFATEAFRSEKSTETSDNSTNVSGEINETFESVSTHPKFRFW